MFYRLHGLADKGLGQEGGGAYFWTLFLFWRNGHIEEHFKGLWTDLMGGRQKARENVKKSHIFYLSKLLVTSGNSVLCLSSFSLCMRSHQHTTFVTWGKVKRPQRGPQLRKWTSTSLRLLQQEQTTSTALGLYGIIFKAQNYPQVWVKRACYGQS